MKKSDATTYLEILCICPNCGACLDLIDDDWIKESLGGELRADNCDVEVNCDECKKAFIVENIYY